MTAINSELAGIFGLLQHPGDYYASGTVDIFTPRLTVDGVGLIALPLLPNQAEQLIAVAERAPYGRGEATLVDTEVRRTWQIGAERVHLAGKHWTHTLKTIVDQAVTGLGVTGAVQAELYKLLVYDQGSFFVSHRDTEKAPGMFATLVIVLPSVYSGGELLVRHRDREVRLDLCRAEPEEAAFAAFYADCVHEVLPVTAGCRLTLIYNLLRTGSGCLPQPPDYRDELADTVTLLRRWSAEQPADEDVPKKLIYPLEHAYSRAELSFDALKGADAAVASLAVAAARQAECDLHLVLLLCQESGGAEYSGSGWDGDELEVGEVYDSSQTVAEWRCSDGSQPAFGEIPFTEKELCPPDAFADMEFQDTEFSEATGNEGASFERSYCWAALVFWPHRHRLAIFNQAGLTATLPYLQQQAERWATDAADFAAPSWQEAHQLAGYMLRTWPEQFGHARYRQQPGNAAAMLAVLYRLRDSVLIERFLADISAEADYGVGDNPDILQAASLLSPQRAAELIERIVTHNAQQVPGAVGNLLARCVATANAIATASLIPAAIALLDALPGDPAHPLPPAWRAPPLQSGLVSDVLYALAVIDAVLAERALDYFLAWPAVYPMDAMLLPAALDLVKAAPHQPVTQRLCASCLAHLRARIAEPLEPPQDWARADTLHCRCPHCTELSRFLADPAQATWCFKAAEALRNHVANTIRRDACDVDTRTDQRGRPYALVCTKNQASYRQRVQQRRLDLESMACLEKGNYSGHIPCPVINCGFAPPLPLGEGWGEGNPKNAIYDRARYN